MSKKLIKTCIALIALAAFAVPATPSAAQSAQVTHPTGTLLATGTKITATNVGSVKFKEDLPGGATIVECSKVAMTGTLTKNDGNNFEANIDTATFSGTGPTTTMTECTGGGSVTVKTNGGGVDGETVTNGTPWCVRATATMGTTDFEIRGGKCSEQPRAMTFIFDTTSIFGTVQCKYTRGTPIYGLLTADNVGGTSDALMHLDPTEETTFTLEENPLGVCTNALTLEMTVTMETDTVAATPVYLDH